jgi:hypothetical protein
LTEKRICPSLIKKRETNVKRWRKDRSNRSLYLAKFYVIGCAHKMSSLLYPQTKINTLKISKQLYKSWKFMTSLQKFSVVPTLNFPLSTFQSLTIKAMRAFVTSATLLLYDQNYVFCCSCDDWLLFSATNTLRISLLTMYIFLTLYKICEIVWKFIKRWG